MCMTRWGVWSLRPVRLFYVVIHAYIIPYSEPIRNCIRNFLANVLLCAHKKTRTLNKVLVNDFGLIITCDNLNIPQYKKQRARKGTFVQKYRKRREIHISQRFSFIRFLLPLLIICRSRIFICPSGQLPIRF